MVPQEWNDSSWFEMNTCSCGLKKPLCVCVWVAFGFSCSCSPVRTAELTLLMKIGLTFSCDYVSKPRVTGESLERKYAQRSTVTAKCNGILSRLTRKGRPCFFHSPSSFCYLFFLFSLFLDSLGGSRQAHQLRANRKFCRALSGKGP